MAVELSPETQEPDRTPEEPRTTPRPYASHLGDAASINDANATDLLVYGTDEILKGTDTATLVAFAALAYQQIKGKGEAHHNLGCILLLISVLACAVVHLSMGNAYVGRARMMLQRRERSRRGRLVRVASYGVAWFAAAFQFLTLLVGLVLILIERPHATLIKYLKPFLQ
jgi:ABC-type Fe3+ transport system permease subunit